MYENLIYKTEGAIASIQLNRPQKKNALNAALREEMEKVLGEIADNASLRTVIITGGEEIFCAGADIGEIQETASAESGYKQARKFQLLFDQVEGLPQPVIAAVSGYAVGGGCELALACDFRFASATAKFGLTEVKIGAIPAGGGTQRLPRLIGAAKAKEMIFTGDIIGAEEALSLGLVMTVVPKAELLERARSFAAKLAVLPRLALESAKRLINKGVEMDLASALELEARSSAALATSHDVREGTLAFLEKRKPNFTGN